MIGLVINIMRRVSEADGREEMKKRVEKWHKKWKGIEQYSMCDKVDEQCDDSLINQRFGFFIIAILLHRNLSMDLVKVVLFV